MAKASKDPQEQKSKLDAALKIMESRYGKGTVISGKNIDEHMEVVTTGSLSLDIATNCGGTPIGKLIEKLGMESSGKSTSTLHDIAEFQKAYPGDKMVLCDYEQSFDRAYATSIGCKVDNLIILQPECMEDGYNMIEELISTGEVRLVVIDSHTAAMPKKVIEGEVGEVTVGLQARINSQALGKIKPLLRPNRCTLIGISQIRQNVGGYGDPNQATGGLAWRFYSDMRMKYTKSLDKENETNKTTVEVIKNKCGSPWGKAQFMIDWGYGINRMQEVIDLAVEYKLLTKAGGWFTVNESKIQGDGGMRQFLRDNEEYCQQLEKDLMEKIKQQ